MLPRLIRCLFRLKKALILCTTRVHFKAASNVGMHIPQVRGLWKRTHNYMPLLEDLLRIFWHSSQVLINSLHKPLIFTDKCKCLGLSLSQTALIGANLSHHQRNSNQATSRIKVDLETDKRFLHQHGRRSSWWCSDVADRSPIQKPGVFSDWSAERSFSVFIHLQLLESYILFFNSVIKSDNP